MKRYLKPLSFCCASLLLAAALAGCAPKSTSTSNVPPLVYTTEDVLPLSTYWAELPEVQPEDLGSQGVGQTHHFALTDPAQIQSFFTWAGGKSMFWGLSAQSIDHIEVIAMLAAADNQLFLIKDQYATPLLQMAPGTQTTLQLEEKGLKNYKGAKISKDNTLSGSGSGAAAPSGALQEYYTSPPTQASFVADFLAFSLDAQKGSYQPVGKVYFILVKKAQANGSAAS